MLADIAREFARHRSLAERAIANLSDEQFFARPGQAVNPVALIVKHIAGNLSSRWRDFLVTDGEKPTRDRDSEFILTERDTRAALMDAWQRGWSTLEATIRELRAEDLDHQITIRREPLTVHQALLRGATHVAYHTGQLLYLVRLLCPAADWLTIAPGTSSAARGTYLKPPVP